MAIIAALLLPALLLLLLWAPSSGPTQAGGGLVYPLYVYPSQATLAGIYTVSSANRAADMSRADRCVLRRMSRARRRRRRRQSS